MQGEVMLNYYPRNITLTLKYHKVTKYQEQTALSSKGQASFRSVQTLDLSQNVIYYLTVTIYHSRFYYYNYIHLMLTKRIFPFVK